MSTYGPVNVLAYHSDDATFRQWAQGIHDAIAGVGLVQTSDTGQINLSTVVRPATNTLAGYEIWRFNDSLQATLPIFIKLEYFGGIGSADRPNFALTVGTTTNGSGTLGGQLGTRSATIAANAAKTAGVTLPTYASGGSGWFSLVTNLDASNGNFAIAIHVERTRDSSGAPTADGIFWSQFNQYNNACQHQTIPASGTVSAVAVDSKPASNPGSGAISKAGTEIALALQTCFVGKPSPLKGFVVYVHADIGELVSFQASVLGATRTFMPMGDGLPSKFGSAIVSPATAVAMLWE